MNPDSLYLKHIRDAIAQIDTYLGGVDHAKFLVTPLLQDAIIRQLQIIGEATKRITAASKQAAPEIAWHQIAGMRNKIIHEYVSVDLEAVWLAVHEDLPRLAVTVDRLISHTKQ